ncbi:lipoprotein [uncultured Sutterella sp.]
MKRPLLTLFLVALLSGCSAAIQYHPFVGDAQVLKGRWRMRQR